MNVGESVLRTRSAEALVNRSITHGLNLSLSTPGRGSPSLAREFFTSLRVIPGARPGCCPGSRRSSCYIGATHGYGRGESALKKSGRSSFRATM